MEDGSKFAHITYGDFFYKEAKTQNYKKIDGNVESVAVTSQKALVIVAVRKTSEFKEFFNYK